MKNLENELRINYFDKKMNLNNISHILKLGKDRFKIFSNLITYLCPDTVKLMTTAI